MAATAPKRKVAYYYDRESAADVKQGLVLELMRSVADVGSYAYTLVHPMRPHRIKMAHNLVVNYGLDRYMDILVGAHSSYRAASFAAHLPFPDPIARGSRARAMLSCLSIIYATETGTRVSARYDGIPHG
jgi:hypothetical protein